MEKKQSDLISAEEQEEKRPTHAENAPTANSAPTEEEHTHGNYLFALKVLAVLAAIILIIIILKASGVPIAIKDWLAGFISHVQSVSANYDPSALLF